MRKALYIRSLQGVVVQESQNKTRGVVEGHNLVEQGADERLSILEAEQNISFLLRAKMVDTLNHYILLSLVPRDGISQNPAFILERTLPPIISAELHRVVAIFGEILREESVHCFDVGMQFYRARKGYIK
jgi:hypothetical protein